MKLIVESRSRFYVSNLKSLLKDSIIPKKKQQLNRLWKQVGNKQIGTVHVQDAIMGMRGLPVLFYDGSALDPLKGILFKGHSIHELQKHSQKAKNGTEPLPEVMWWLLVTGNFPTDAQFRQLRQEWTQRGNLKDNVINFILELPNNLHPMTMLSMAMLYLQKDSEFFRAYQVGVHKSKHWQLYYEDAMNLVAKLPRIAAVIYRRKYRNSELIDADNDLDWAANYAHMLGYDKNEIKECLRGYLSIHSDHEGGNVSAHTAHLVGSALSDPYLSYSAALNGLAGPLHGLANQQCLKWLIDLQEYHDGQTPNKQIIEQFVNKTLQAGRVIPGYGHAVLRKVDPRFMHLKQFAEKNIRNDYICDLASLCFDTVPQILGRTGKIKNPYPNVDAYSGCLLHHYGIRQFDYYTVAFGVSRSLGCLSNGIWARAFGLPIERPSSIDISFIEKLGLK